MLLLDDTNLYLTESSSKGNQKKFYIDGTWIKLDSEHCHQGLAESFVSSFCDCIYNFPHVHYESLEDVYYKDNKYNACASNNMYDLNTMFVTVRSILRSLGYTKVLLATPNNFDFTVQQIYQVTNIDITYYLGRLLYLDTLILNEDRHWMNIGVCKDNTGFKEALCFDNGSSLLCTNWTYSKKYTLEQNIKRVQSYTFSKFFDIQVQMAQELNCPPLQIDYNKLTYLLNNYYNPLYNDELNLRIKRVLNSRLNYNKDKGVYVYV